MFDGIGFWELLIVGVVALLVLGPERLPTAVRSTSRTLRGIKAMASNFRQEVEQQLNAHELHENLKKAEQKNMQDLSPDVQRSVDELRKAAEAVQKPYQNDKKE